MDLTFSLAMTKDTLIFDDDACDHRCIQYLLDKRTCPTLFKFGNDNIDAALLLLFLIDLICFGLDIRDDILLILLDRNVDPISSSRVRCLQY